MRTEHGSRVTIAQVAAAVSLFYGESIADLCGPDRHRPLVRRRQTAMAIAYRLTGHSLPTVGRKFGGRDHTTVMYACRKVASREAIDPSFRDEVAEISNLALGLGADARDQRATAALGNPAPAAPAHPDEIAMRDAWRAQLRETRT